MHKKVLLALALLAAPVAATAAESLVEDREIDGRSTYGIIANLHQQGIDAQRVETWGDAIRVEARGTDGQTYMVIVDRDTLRPLNTSGEHRGTIRVEAGTRSLNTNEIPVSVVE